MNLRLKIAGAVSTIALLASDISHCPRNTFGQQRLSQHALSANKRWLQITRLNRCQSANDTSRGKYYGTRATAAFAAGDLPDVIYYPLSFALPWAEAGILTQKLHKKYLMISVRIHLLLDR